MQNITTKASCGASIWNLCGALKTSGTCELKNVQPLCLNLNCIWNLEFFEGGTVEPLWKASGMWSLLSLEPWCGTSGNLVPGFRPLPQARSFIGRTPSFSSCWGKRNIYIYIYLYLFKKKKNSTTDYTPVTTVPRHWPSFCSPCFSCPAARWTFMKQ